MFFIGFTEEPTEDPYDDASVQAAPGNLQLGASVEGFLSNLSLWDKSEYEAHWMRELRALVEGSSKIVLVVSYDDPKHSLNLEIWRVYRDGELAHFQNQLPWYSKLPKNFDICKMGEYVQNRSTATAEGNHYSEWHIPISDIEAFNRGFHKGP